MDSIPIFIARKGKNRAFMVEIFKKHLYFGGKMFFEFRCQIDKLSIYLQKVLRDYEQCKNFFCILTLSDKNYFTILSCPSVTD